MSTEADSYVFARATEEKDNTHLTCPQLPLPHPPECMDLFHTFTVKKDYSDLTLLWSKLLQIVKAHPHTTVLAHPQKWSLVCVSWKFVSMAKVVICLFQNNAGGDGGDGGDGPAGYSGRFQRIQWAIYSERAARIQRTPAPPYPARQRRQRNTTSSRSANLWYKSRLPNVRRACILGG